MKAYSVRLAIAAAASIMPSLAFAQHEAHQATATQASSAELAQCVRVQPAIENIIKAATARLDAARLSNSPTEMRAAVDHLEAALRDIRTQLTPCATAAASTDPHAGHTMPTSQPPAGTPAQTPAGTTDPHAGHKTPGAAPPSKGPTKEKPVASKPSKPAADPHAGHAAQSTSPSKKSSTSAAKPEGTKATDPHAGHSSTQPSGKQMDPVNGLMVDSATAPKATYQGQTYYFSSEQSKKEFLANPAKFAKKPKG